jgi:hypothetical protein
MPLRIASTSGISFCWIVNDNGNPAWEDIKYEPDDKYEFEIRWRMDEKASQDGEVLVDTSAKDLKPTGLQSEQAYRQACNMS